MQIQEIINRVLFTPNSAFFYTPTIYGESKSYLFLKPQKKVIINSLKQLDKKLNEIDDIIKKGFVGYSLMNYEAGYLFERNLHKYLPGKESLIQFYFYNKNEIIEIDSNTIELSTDEKFKINNFTLNTTKKEYLYSIKKIKNYIAEGDTYQVNYTVKGKFNLTGSIASLFAHLVFNQSARYIAFINNNQNLIISLSPELFFEIKGKQIISKPMKGTIRRGINASDDKQCFEELERSEKNMAENVMIVDMIRNDLGRISKYGSIRVKNLFEVEKYESVFQMISTIEGTLKKTIKLSDVIKNIFPCGSITGAPKIRTMEIIREIEKEDRGIYTGSIGLLIRDKKIFNVAIRTLVINKKNHSGEIGLGSGIVWDSNPSEEYEETKLKGKFLTHPVDSFEIFETMKYDKGRIFLLNLHLKRLKEAANHFLFNYSSGLIKSELKNLIKKLDTETKIIKMSLSKQGEIKFEVRPYKKSVGKIKVAISENNIDLHNPFQYFKTTNRELYNNEYKTYSSKGFFDVIYFNQNGELVEGAITNIFIKKKNVLFTPPVESGLLSGVYRNYLIKKYPEIVQKKLYLKDILSADELFLTNSVREKVIVNEIYFSGKRIKSFN